MTTTTAAELAYLCRALKAPSLAQAVPRLCERANDEGWSHQEFLVAALEKEVQARVASGAEIRVKGAKFPGRKSLDDFDYDHQRSVKRELVAHLSGLDFITEKRNIVLLGPPGTGKSHLAVGLGVKAAHGGHRVAFATAVEWVRRLSEAHATGRLGDEITKLKRVPLLIIDEVGYLPFDAEAANLFFQLVSARYEQGSIIVTSNKAFGQWGDVFGDATVAAAMIDRLVHHAEVINLKGDSYRMKDRILTKADNNTE